MSSRVPREVKEFVAERSGYRCEYCLSPMHCNPDQPSIEHIHPRSRGGGDAPSNLALSCQGCNNFKQTAIAAEDPATGVQTPLFHPRTDRWADHFAWSSDDQVSVIGKTPTGRATIARLQFNRPSLLDQRRLLMLAGLHPPDIESEKLK